MPKSNKKMEAVLDFLINEEKQQAADLLHEIIVEKSRDLYESLIMEMEDDELGGDPKEDFADDISADMDDVASDEEFDDGEEFTDGAGEEFEGDMEGEGDVEDRIMDLESELEALRADFEQLLDQEADEPYHDEEELGAAGLEDDFEADELDDEEFVDDEFGGEFEDDLVESRRKKQQMIKARRAKRMAEATELQKTVMDKNLLTAGNKQEGKLVGTGSKSKTGETFKTSPYTNPPSKENYGGAPIKGKDGGQGKEGDKSVQKSKYDGSNIGVSSKNVSDPSNEGKDDKSANKSPFTQRPKKTTSSK